MKKTTASVFDECLHKYIITEDSLLFGQVSKLITNTSPEAIYVRVVVLHVIVEVGVVLVSVRVEAKINAGAIAGPPSAVVHVNIHSGTLKVLYSLEPGTVTATQAVNQHDGVRDFLR